MLLGTIGSPVLADDPSALVHQQTQESAAIPADAGSLTREQNPKTGDVTITFDTGVALDQAELGRLVGETQAKNDRLSDTFKQDFEAHKLDIPHNGTDQWVDFDGTLTATPTGISITIPSADVRAEASWWQSIVATVAGVATNLVVRTLCIGLQPEWVIACAAIGAFTGGMVRGTILQGFDGTLKDGKAWANTLISSLALAVGAAAWEAGVNVWARDTLPGILQAIGNAVVNLSRSMANWLGEQWSALVRTTGEAIRDFARYVADAARNFEVVPSNVQPPPPGKPGGPAGELREARMRELQQQLEAAMRQQGAAPTG
ncbi:hypothetical protein ETD83_05580 [Actinomadura soli]|uniref:Uncharacterized protein n=1 Tax=Actinomadura soli TaxID=2508997 RepID=A0A5C4JHB4_9ACTN|nr:hypothetical protein [Actinomadura soli]TMR05710.1 hypothetical protein ETD83_05580 [Actinomadura soli]